jgi:predicted TPR repeat methyltransferase
MLVMLIIIYLGTCVQQVSSFHSSLFSRATFFTKSSLVVSMIHENDQLILDIGKALKSRPNEEPLLFNLGMLLSQKIETTASEKFKEKGNLITEALDAFTKAVKLNDKRDASWFNIASLKQQSGDNHGATVAYRQAIRVSENNDVLAASYSNLVQLLLEKGDLEEAATVSNQAVNALPDDPTAWTNMGIVLRENLSYDWAAKCFENAVKFSDGNDAVALNNLGNIYSRNNEVDKAYSSYNQALQADPNDEASAYSLAIILRDSGDQTASRDMFKKCIDINPENTAASFQLEALLGNSDVEQCPPDYVADLFDHYAKIGYDTHMVNSLQYKVPNYMWDACVSTSPAAPSAEPLVIVELGAGTGLVGRRFRTGLSDIFSTTGHSDVDEFTACDLSQEMILRAYELTYKFRSEADEVVIDSVTSLPEQQEEEENVYTDVVIAECSDYLQTRAEQGRPPADLILAGDVLVYMGNLEPLFRNVKSSLSVPPGTPGRFIFSVEKLSEDVGQAKNGFLLQESARFAHTKQYIEETARSAGLTVLSCSEVPLRSDGGNSINGYIFVLQ